MTNDDLSPREQYENLLRLLLSTLAVLSAPAHEQCSIMGNYNVAWELKRDGINLTGHFLHLHPQPFDSETIDALRSVQRALELMPRLAIEPGVNTRTAEGCLVSMRHSAWDDIRTLASGALKRLEEQAQSNSDYFESKADTRRQ